MFVVLVENSKCSAKGAAGGGEGEEEEVERIESKILLLRNEIDELFKDFSLCKIRNLFL